MCHVCLCVSVCTCLCLCVSVCVLCVCPHVSLRVWHGVGFVVCSELVACVVFRLKRCVVTALFARVVVHRQPQTDTDRQTHTQTRTDTDTSDCLFVCLSFHVFQDFLLS